MAELHLYDFDGTLFRSPERPAGWDGRWWSSAVSLLPPCVPERPGSEWWVSATVASAKRSVSEQEVFAILCTGRPANAGLRFRVAELLKQKGLDFDEVYLKGNRGGDTDTQKVRVIVTLLRRYPIIDTVRIWEDRPTHVAPLVGAAKKMGVLPENIHVTMVRVSPHAVGCAVEDLPEKMAFSKTAVVVSPDHYLIDQETGEYVWSPKLVKEAWRQAARKLQRLLMDPKIKKVVLLVGVPASGKSTWLSSHHEADTVYFDATFTSQRARFPIMEIARGAGKPVEAVVMETPLPVCLERNECRSTDRRVPDEVVLRMHHSLLGDPPTMGEGFSRILKVR